MKSTSGDGDEPLSKTFFSTPLGWFVIFILVMLGLGAIRFLVKGKNKNNWTPTQTNFDANYYLRH